MPSFVEEEGFRALSIDERPWLKWEKQFELGLRCDADPLARLRRSAAAVLVGGVR